MGASASGHRPTEFVDRIKPTSEQRAPKTKRKWGTLVSTKSLSKWSLKRNLASREHVKWFRDLVSSWPLTDLKSLSNEYEVLNILKSLQEDADSVRAGFSSIGDQLLASTSQDVVLYYQDVQLPVHKFFFSVRCNNIRIGIGNEVQLEPPTTLELTLDEMRKLLVFVYTSRWDGSLERLEELKRWLGCQKPLDMDLMEMERKSCINGDLIVALSNSNCPSSNEGCVSYCEFKCDASLLAGRSPLLEKLLKNNSGKIVLDEAVLPRGFAPLIFHYLYTDQMDLKKVSETATVTHSSLSEARAIISGRSPNSEMNRAIQLVHIAMFFQLPRLQHLCEDIIVSALCPDSCISVLTWALDGGSVYVARQAQRFLEANFATIASTHHLFDLSLDMLTKCVKSQFVQATEVELLETIIKWAEHALLKRMEEREPNVVADTTHSISRKGVRRGDLDSHEFLQIVSPLTEFIRTDFILPPFHQALNNAYARGILERGPLRDLICSSTAEINPDIHWFRPDDRAPGPRFYAPYYKELKLRFPVDKSLSITTDSNPLDVYINNLLPELISNEHFQQIKLRILCEINNVQILYKISTFPREFQRETAVELVTTKVVRVLDVPPEAIKVSLVGRQSPSTSTLPDVVLQENS